MTEVDPFDFPDPGFVPEKEHRLMSGKQLSNASLRLPGTDRPRLSTYARDGGYTPLAKVEGVELLIQSIELVTTQFGEAYKLGCVEEASGSIHVLCCGQVVVKKAIEALLAEAEAEGREVQFPIPVRFVKPGQAWLVA